MIRFGLRLCGALVGLLLATDAAVAASGTALRLESVARSAELVEAKLASLEREYSHRRGLIGAHTAEGRFEDAVFAYLVEDYEAAAVTFYTLVESDALTNPALARDAEWYLAECLLEFRNTRAAVEAYDRIIAFGQAHPFFNDAVRRQLEAYGYLSDSDGFYRVYNRFIVTAIVPITDAVKYSMAKSFYHQGDWTRAKSLFAEVSGESDMYTRARYFLGAILVAEGQLEAAVPEFQRVTQYMPPVTAMGYRGVGGIREFAAMRELEGGVVEMANLALGRIHYELGELNKALEFYQAVPAESAYFTDQLYELVWVHLKREQWLEAISQIEVFLIAFPDHQYAFQLRLLLGHLHMRRGSYERALGTYEKVVEQYGPIRDHLVSIGASPTRPDDFFEALVESAKLSEVDPSIPAFAVHLLSDDALVSRAVEVRRELNRQGDDLSVTQNLIDEIAPALGQGVQAIGTFRAGRSQVGSVRNDSLKLRLDVLDAELSLHEDDDNAAIPQRVVALRAQWDALATRAERLRSDENDSVERATAAAESSSAISAMKRELIQRAGDLSADEEAALRLKVSNAEARLKEDLAAMSQASDVGAQRGLVGDDLSALRTNISALRRGASSTALSTFESLDSAWTRGSKVDRRAVSVMAKLERAEQAELALMRASLDEHARAVIGLNGELAKTNQTADGVASAVTRTGIGAVGAEFNETVMGADRGIVDVYWTRKVGVTDEIQRLNEERGLRSAELDSRFELIRQRMGQNREASP
ncbi:MAG: tetratricopeptide repeat protein [Myxococcota bacterium]|nr:tetratricopeptide repeat protein [Myxococcota bacterium]